MIKSYTPSLPAVEVDEAKRLCAYHLAQAAALFPIGYDTENPSGAILEMTALMAGWNPEGPGYEAACAWKDAMQNFYDELNEGDE